VVDGLELIETPVYRKVVVYALEQRYQGGGGFSTPRGRQQDPEAPPSLPSARIVEAVQTHGTNSKAHNLPGILLLCLGLTIVALMWMEGIVEASIAAVAMTAPFIGVVWVLVLSWLAAEGNAVILTEQFKITAKGGTFGQGILGVGYDLQTIPLPTASPTRSRSLSRSMDRLTS